MLGTWILFRLLYFPWIVYGLVFEAHYPEHISEFNNFFKFIGVFLSVLILLHIYWFVMMIKMGFHLARTGKPEDIVNKVQESHKV